MPYEVEVAHLPEAITLNTADEGETVELISSDFATDEQGRTFYDYLDNLERLFLQPYLNIRHMVSTIDHCLVLMDKRTGKAVVYINELEIVQEIIPKRTFVAGEPIFKPDIGGILSLSFKNVPIPDKCGLIFYFSVGWKRGIFFDFRPNSSGRHKLENINKQLGTFYESLFFYEIYSVNKETWDKVISEGWFPFVSLLGSNEFKGLIDRIREGKPIDKREEIVIELFNQESLEKIRDKFQQLDFLKPHFPFLEKGIERYLAGDYISSINNIWPRIEGILRYAYTKGKKRPSQTLLADNIEDMVANQSISPQIFFPEMFREYLLKFYFRDFDLQTEQLNISRNSISHGVSNSETYTQKSALLGILIVDQLFYYSSVRKPQKKQKAKQKPGS